MLHQYRALLIQDVREFRQFVADSLYAAVALYETQGAEPEHVLAWIIRQHIQESHLLFDTQHHYAPMCRAIYDHINHALEGRLETYLSFYIKVPHLYGDNNQIKVVLRSRDLFIYY